MGSGLWSRSSVTIIQSNSVDDRSIHRTTINQSIPCIKGTDLTSPELGTARGVQVLLVVLTKAGVCVSWKGFHCSLIN